MGSLFSLKWVHPSPDVEYYMYLLQGSTVSNPCRVRLPSILDWTMAERLGWLG